MNNNTLCIVLSIIILFSFYIFLLEPRLLKTERCHLYKGDDRLILLQLSDLHLRDLKIKVEHINKVIARESPDIIAITGDMLDREDDLVNMDNFLSSLARPCPVIITLGNHDMKVVRSEDDIRALKRLLTKFPEVTLLHNEKARVSRGSREFDIIGIADAQSEYYSPDHINSMISSADGIRIVLSHNPDAACDIMPGSCECIICGHLHGGQIWMPFNFEFTLLRNDRLPKKGYKEGLYVINGNKVYISRGIGTSLIPARFLSRPEITVFYL